MRFGRWLVLNGALKVTSWTKTGHADVVLPPNGWLRSLNAFLVKFVIEAA